MDRIEALVERVLLWEGGRSNDPVDPGGDTSWGITRRDYPQLWVNGPPTKDDARHFYRRLFDELRCGELPPGVAAVYFDFSIQSGSDDAARELQRLVWPPAFRAREVDSILGDRTIGRTWGEADSRGDLTLAFQLLEVRTRLLMNWVQRVPVRIKFVEGFSARMVQLGHHVARVSQR